MCVARRRIGPGPVGPARQPGNSQRYCTAAGSAKQSQTPHQSPRWCTLCGAPLHRALVGLRHHFGLRYRLVSGFGTGLYRASVHACIGLRYKLALVGLRHHFGHRYRLVSGFDTSLLLWGFGLSWCLHRRNSPRQPREGRWSIAVRHYIRTPVGMKLSGVVRGSRRERQGHREW